MKKCLNFTMLFIGALFLSTVSCYSQGLAVNTDGSTADPSAMLDIKATDKGMLIPRVSSTANVTSPVTGLLVYQTIAPAGFYYYDGAGWLLLQNTSYIASDSTGGAAGGSLTGTYPNPTITSGGVTTTEILDGTITGTDVSPTAAIPYSKLSLTNSVQNGDIVASAITTSKVANGTVTMSKMADSAISGLKLLTGAVGVKHISTIGASTGQAMIFNGSAVSWATPAGGGAPTGAAGGSLAGIYPNPTIAASAITTDEILDGTITGTDVSPTAAIPYSKLSLTSSVQNSDIVANAITTSKVANGTVTMSKMADSAISGLKLLTGAVGVKHISTVGAATGQAMIFDGSAVSWATPAGGGAPTGAAGGSLTGTYPNPAITAGGVTTTEILDGTITGTDVSPTAAIPYSKLSLTNSVQNGDIVANAITTSKVANGTVTTSKMADSAISGLKLLTGAVGIKHISTVGAGAGQAMVFNGTTVGWGTPANGVSNYGTPLLKSANYVISPTDQFIYTTTDGLTFTLPSAAIAGAGKVLYLMSSSVTGISVVPSAGNFMTFPEGNPAVTSSTLFYFATFVSDGNNKWIAVAMRLVYL